MGLERFQDAAIGLPTYVEPVANYQMKVNDLVVRSYGSGAMFNVRLATAAALGAVTASGSGKNKTLTQDSFAVEAIDGVAPVVGDLILVQDQSSAIDNGIYRITVVGDAVSAVQTLVRAVEYDSTAEVILGTLFHVLEGTVNGDTIVHISTAPAVLDTNNWDFTAGIYAAITITLPPVSETKGKLFSILTRAATPALPVTIADKDDSEGWGGDYAFVAAGNSVMFYSDGIKWTAIFGGVGVLSVRTELTNTQIINLRATPITIVPALGATKLVEFLSVTLRLNYGGTNGFTETSDNFVVRYTDESGVIVSDTIEMTGFIDQTADTITRGVPINDAIVVPGGAANAALVLDNSGDGEIAGNAGVDNTITVWTLFRVIDVG